ncbi:MAG: hypothetical protein C0498_01040 [Anaerolinea sp.]|nr:hypothetical protein [Anaerolinea sp.]
MRAPGRLDAVVSGYASLDEAFRASHHAGGGETAILRGPVHPTAGRGGCGPNAALALARLGLRSGLVTWLGDDPDGRAYFDHLRAAGVDLTGVEVGHGRSPRSLLIYDPDGAAACYFHPSRSAEQRLSQALRAQLAEVGWLAITVGPASVTQSLLDAAAPDTRLAWNVKADRAAFPPELVRRLIRSEVVCLNEAELAFVARQVGNGFAASSEALVDVGAGCVALTMGRRGYRLVSRDEQLTETVEPIEASDPTGAGDAFFAGFLAALIRGASLRDAGRQAAALAAELLRSRPTAAGGGAA